MGTCRRTSDFGQKDLIDLKVAARRISEREYFTYKFNIIPCMMGTYESSICRNLNFQENNIRIYNRDIFTYIREIRSKEPLAKVFRSVTM